MPFPCPEFYSLTHAEMPTKCQSCSNVEPHIKSPRLITLSQAKWNSYQLPAHSAVFCFFYFRMTSLSRGIANVIVLPEHQRCNLSRMIFQVLTPAQSVLQWGQTIHHCIFPWIIFVWLIDCEWIKYCFWLVLLYCMYLFAYTSSAITAGYIYLYNANIYNILFIHKVQSPLFAFIPVINSVSMSLFLFNCALHLTINLAKARFICFLKQKLE